MKSPIFIKTNQGHDVSYYISEHVGAYFSYPFHFHPEYELTYIIEGKGTRFVGNSIEHFGPGDLILIGTNVPHYWRNSQEYYEPESNLKVHAIVVRFLYQLGGVNLFDLPEMAIIKKLLQESVYGVKVSGQALAVVTNCLKEMLSAKNENNIILLLQALSAIARSNEKQFLISTAIKPLSDVEIQRINDIYEYMVNHCTGKISLKEIANVANLQTASFCRYFKERFRKTFTDAVNEIRVTKACGLLQQKDISVAQAAFESGFHNLANFTRNFKKTVGHSPKQYQNLMLKGSL